MINLLPDKQKKELALEKIQGRVLLVFFFVSLALLIFIFILFCLSFYTDSQVESIGLVLQQKETEFQTSQFDNCKESIIQMNQTLCRVKNFWSKQFFLSVVLEELLNLTPNSIRFESFSLKKEDDRASVSFAGTSATRGALFYFKESLEESPYFSQVNFLPSSWMLPVNAKFFANVEFASEQPKK